MKHYWHIPITSNSYPNSFIRVTKWYKQQAAKITRMRSVKLEHELLWVSKCWLYKTTCTARVIKSKLTAKERKKERKKATFAHVNCSTYITLILFWIPKLASILFWWCYNTPYIYTYTGISVQYTNNNVLVHLYCVHF
mgnify:CR=1 FL=1